VPVVPGMDEVAESTEPVDGMPVVPMEVPVDPALVLLFPAMPLSGGRTTTGDMRGPSFWTSSEHVVAASVDSVAEVQRWSMRLASTPDRLGLGMVWASAEPASRSAASGASETGEDLFMACSFSDCCSGLKSTACRLTKSLEQAVAEFCSVAHGRFRVAEETNSGGNCIDRKCLYRAIQRFTWQNQTRQNRQETAREDKEASQAEAINNLVATDQKWPRKFEQHDKWKLRA